MFSRDGIDVVAVGDSGLVLRSLDGGSSWFAQSVGGAALHDCAALSSTIWMVGDGGRILRSRNRGGTWTELVATNANLYAISMLDAFQGIAVGDLGTILRTGNGGDSWEPVASGTSQSLRAVQFRSLGHGWVVGTSGTVLRTGDAGATWVNVSTPTTEHLHSVDFNGAEVWIAGENATALRTASYGAAWTTLPLKIDSKSKVNCVRLSAGAAFLAGGGGFIRKSDDKGATWQFMEHPLLEEISDIHWQEDGILGWACSRKSRTVIRTTDAGATWNLPVGTTTTYTWSLKQALTQGISRGSTLVEHGTNHHTIYCALGQNVYHSPNRGDTWTLAGSVPGVTKINALLISPADSSSMVALVDGPDRVVRSVDGGTNWVTVLTADFSEYGVPLEMDPDLPSRILFAPEDGKLYRSLDFGMTFEVISTPGFLSPCDIEIVPDSSNIVYVGDGLTNFGNATMYRSTDAGFTFEPMYSSPGREIPMIATSRLDPSVAFATNWSVGGLWRTTDYGASWSSLFNAASAWGVAFAQDDPNVAAVGSFGAGICYLTMNQGQRFTPIPLGSANYNFLILDRATFLAQQGTGIYKLAVKYTVPPSSPPAIQVTAPNGGENLFVGQAVEVAWSATNVALVRIEYQDNPAASWQVIAADVEANRGRISWGISVAPTSTARIRVVDSWDAMPADSSDASFAIHVSTDVAEDDARGLELVSAGIQPGSGAALIRYRLPNSVHVQLEVFDARGRRVAILANGLQAAGEHRVLFPPNTGPDSHRGVAGVYFARLQAGTASRSVKVLAMR